jgi:hypothetical protein
VKSLLADMAKKKLQRAIAPREELNVELSRAA